MFTFDILKWNFNSSQKLLWNVNWEHKINLNNLLEKLLLVTVVNGWFMLLTMGVDAAEFTLLILLPLLTDGYLFIDEGKGTTICCCW